jgi:glycosyltransferase involved in cell wall biosynthesis
MTHTPLVTIGLPVYNSERFIRQSLDSLLGQTYRDFILIISDNASTDTTAEICQSYAKSDGRIQYHRNAVNIGNPGNFNRVFSLTRTKYLKWSTSDDWWAPTFVERALEVMERDPGIALCYPQAYIVDADGANPQPYDDVLHLMQDDPAERFLKVIDTIALAHQHLGLIRTDALRRTRLLGAFVASDINLLAELTLYGKYFELPERLFYRRYHKTSGSWNRGNKEHEAKYYLAAKRPTIRFTRWRRHIRFFSAALRAPLPPGKKLWLCWKLFRRLLSDRELLIKDLFGRA